MSHAIALDLDCDQDRPASTGVVSIECDPQLIEQAVSGALLGAAHARAYHTAREACYDEADSEVRDQLFAKLDREWFVKLDLARPVMRACGEWPDIMSRVGRCILAPCIRRKDECAELYGRYSQTGGNGPRPNLIVRLHPDSFGHPAHLQALLRHELMHIRDMLDPEFEYDPSLSQFHDETGIPNAIRDRYRILWDTYIDGRLSRRDAAEPSTRTRRLEEFSKPFRVLGRRTPEAFDAVFDAHGLTHPEILAFARMPLALLHHLDARRQQT